LGGEFEGAVLCETLAKIKLDNCLLRFVETFIPQVLLKDFWENWVVLYSVIPNDHLSGDFV